MNPSDAVPWVTIIAIAVPALGAFGSIIVFFVKRLMRAERESSELKFTHLNQAVVQLQSRDEQLLSAHDRMRDKWDEFLREYLKIDSTRGQKVDALFRIVDQMQETMREIRPAINSKIEDSFSRALSELKIYVRDQMREAKP